MNFAIIELIVFNEAASEINMFITVTSLKLKKLPLYFAMSWNAFRITRQLKGHSDFLKLKNTGFGYTHFTISSWKTKESIVKFAHSGAHNVALKQSRKIASEICTYTYESDDFPSWPEAKRLLLEKGKKITF